MTRVKHALSAVGLDGNVPLERASSVTNEVWLTPDHAVRLNRKADQRLAREAHVVHHLPDAVPHPAIVGYGEAAGFDWVVVERVSGHVLARCWPTMSDSQRRSAVRQLATILQALHATPCPPGLEPVRSPQLLDGALRGSPVEPIFDAAARAERLPNVDRLLLADAREWVTRHADALQPYSTATLVHGDLTFENLLWDGDRITALIDFELARGAPPDLELDILLRFCAHPELHVADDYADHTKAEEYTAVPEWLVDDYPALFANERVLERLRIYAIGFEIGRLLEAPPNGPRGQLPPLHPMRRLHRLLGESSYLDGVNDIFP